LIHRLLTFLTDITAIFNEQRLSDAPATFARSAQQRRRINLVELNRRADVAVHWAV